jgi:hypothetical protein
MQIAVSFSDTSSPTYCSIAVLHDCKARGWASSIPGELIPRAFYGSIPGITPCVRIADQGFRVHLCGARVLISVLVMTPKESLGMTTWPSLLSGPAQ